jgi:hypothetical protein
MVLKHHILPSLQKFTTQRAFILHAASLRQTFVHCAIFLTAASRRSLDRVSVPVWLIILSDQLPIVGLVSRYLTNYLMGCRPIHWRPKALTTSPCGAAASSGISTAFAGLSQTKGQVTYRLLTRAPVYYGYCYPILPDLHVLGTPPAFVLSQDQTLRCNSEI